MNYLKLQTDILKAWERENTRGKKSPFMYGLLDETVGITVDEHYIVMVPRCAFALDLKRVFEKQEPYDLTRFTDYHDTEPIYDTGILRITADGRKVRVFSSSNDEIWIDEKYFGYFGQDVTEYRGSAKNKPVFLFEEEVLVGMLLPVAHS